ncbi:MAG: phospholipase A [Epsilonproteobacteria bacterium]|nr:phospholipase A [Campylobacterota bacterium]
MPFIIVFVLLVSSLQASTADAYVQAVKHYHQQFYKQAYTIIEKEAIKGNKEAQYLLASMYEDGKGVDQDLKQSIYWYKKAASKYTYIVEQKPFESELTKENFIQRVKHQMTYTAEEKGNHFAFSKVDSSVPAVKSHLLKMLENNFGLLPYHTNYVAPFTYASTKYSRHFAGFQQHNIPQEWQAFVDYDDHVEAEYQLSFQKPLTYNLFGWNEYVSFAYTQRVWWKLYDESGPFRETNYLPELFMIIPTSDAIDEKYNLKAVKVGYRHQSNGQEGYHSRSWDRLFLATMWQFKNLFIKAEGWYRFPESKKGEDFYSGANPKAKGDDNPDIHRYMGYGDLGIFYLFGKDQISLLWRNNLHRHNNRGAIQIDYSTPFFNSDNTYWYMKLFSGYGENMIDYDRSINKISIGFAYSRGIF